MTTEPDVPDARSLFLLACSPRVGGNCDHAAALFARGWTDASTCAPHAEELVSRNLRDFRVSPCLDCGSCARMARRAADAGSGPGLNWAWEEPAPGGVLGCPQSPGDDSPYLLKALARAGSLVIVAPIYFYHLPAQLKALVDRTQPFWLMSRAGRPNLFPQVRHCHTILLGARKKGDKLFEGSLLNLRYALAPLGIQLAEPLLLYGLERPSDLSDHPEYGQKILAYAAAAAAQGPGAVSG